VVAGRVGGDVKMRWLSVLAAAVGAVALAGGTAMAADRVFLGSTARPPSLKGVSNSTLSQMGVTLSSAQAPAYCGVVSVAKEHGVSPPGKTGCPVSRETAEATFRRTLPGWAGSGLGAAAMAPANSPPGTVQDAVLVRASVPRQPAIGSDRLVWLFVVKGAFPPYRATPLVCVSQVSGSISGPICRGPSLTELVFVDAATSQYLTALPVGLQGGARPLPFTRMPPTVVSPVGSPAPRSPASVP
jgi:hypothetical protein